MEAFELEEGKEVDMHKCDGPSTLAVLASPLEIAITLTLTIHSSISDLQVS
jgi:hypothetical protein